MSVMIRRVVLLLVFISFYFGVSSQDSVVVYTKRGFSGDRPKIGLVLSGGGAKGIAHVGFLRVMEEAGIHPDFISGTSMGSLVGALYAVGFSVDSIESMIYSQDWDEVLSNKINYRSVNMEEKTDYGEYIAELPFYGWKPGLPSGAIKGQELELLFEKLTVTAAGDTCFDSLYIPYRAVATDLLTGKAYVFKSGSLALAMRSSMSIPTIMQPIKYRGMLLVDGGLVENFPVSVVKDMGADIIIGVYTGGQLLPESDLTSLLAILKQSSMMGGILDAKKQRENVDIFIEPYLNDMSASDFYAGSEFYKRGYDAAKKKLPELLALAEYMKQFDVKVKARPVMKDSIIVSQIDYSDIENQKYKSLAKNMLYKNTGDWSSYEEIKHQVDQLYGTRLFQKVGFHFDKSDSAFNDGVKLVYDLEERKPKFLNIALHYRNESKIGLIVGAAFRNVLLPMSKLELKFRISEYPAAKVRYFTYMGYTTKFGTSVSYNFYASDVPIYIGKTLSARYTRFLASFNGKLSYFPNIKSSFNILGRYETTRYKKSIDLENASFSSIEARGWFTGLSYELNTFDNKYFTYKGLRVKLMSEVNLASQEIYWLEPDTVFANPGFPESYDLYIEPFIQTSFLIESYTKLSKKWIVSNNLFSVVSSKPNGEVIHTYLVGGIYPGDPNQIPFWGLPENTVFLNNGLVYGLGFRYEAMRNLFFGIKLNGMFQADDIADVLDPNEDVSYIGNYNNYYLGAGVEVSYRSVLGPIGFGIGINDVYLDVWSHLRIGFKF